MEYEWSIYPDKVPTQSGYYLTLYFNTEKQGYYTKCIWWNGNKWSPWRTGVMTDKDIKGFVQDTYNQYYAPCMFNSNKTVTSIDIELFKDLKTGDTQ